MRRFVRAVSYGMLLLAAVLTGWLALRREPVPHERYAIDWCRSAYARARTAADSALVDGQRPPASHLDRPAAVMCGTRRHAGQL